MDFSDLQELKLKVTDPNFILPTQIRWHIKYDGKVQLLDVMEIFNLLIDDEICLFESCRDENYSFTTPIREDKDLMKSFLMIKEHLEEENKILLHNLKERRKLIVEFQMKFESALSKLRDLDVMQDVLATVQIIELRPRVKVKRKVKKKVVFNLENNCVLGVHEHLHVSEKDVTPDPVEGESSGSENEKDVQSESDVLDSESKSLNSESEEKVISDEKTSCNPFEGMVAYKKPILQNLQKYQTRNYVPKTQDVQIPKCDVHIRNENSYLKPRYSEQKKKKRRVKKIWMPNVNVNSVQSWRDKKMYQCWYNVVIDNFCFPTKEPRRSNSSYYSEDGLFSPKECVCKVSSPILNLKWVPKNLC